MSKINNKNLIDRQEIQKTTGRLCHREQRLCKQSCVWSYDSVVIGADGFHLQLRVSVSNKGNSPLLKNTHMRGNTNIKVTNNADTWRFGSHNIFWLDRQSHDKGDTDRCYLFLTGTGGQKGKCVRFIKFNSKVHLLSACRYIFFSVKY